MYFSNLLSTGKIKTLNYFQVQFGRLKSFSDSDKMFERFTQTKFNGCAVKGIKNDTSLVCNNQDYTLLYFPGIFKSLSYHFIL